MQISTVEISQLGILMISLSVSVPGKKFAPVNRTITPLAFGSFQVSIGALL